MGNSTFLTPIYFLGSCLYSKVRFGLGGAGEDLGSAFPVGGAAGDVFFGEFRVPSRKTRGVLSPWQPSSSSSSSSKGLRVGS